VRGEGREENKKKEGEANKAANKANIYSEHSF
jgi:hypothetical protein